MKVLILYFTRTGHTLEAVSAIAKGIYSAGSQADLIEVRDFSAAKLANYDALIVGSPCWGGSLGAGVAKPIVKALNSLKPEALQGKKCSGISVYAWKGANNTVKDLGKILRQKGCQDYIPGPITRAGVPFSLWKGPAVSPEDEEHFRAFGVDFVA
jgi:flavodoxin